MKVLIKSALIVCPSSAFHGKNIDILIENGIIKNIDNSIAEKADQVIEINNLHVSLGWADLFANFGDPGFEQKESLTSGSNTAAAGGFTHVAIIPNTNPVIDNKAQVAYVGQKSQFLPATIWPLGAITKSGLGKDLTEMYDMRDSGAVAFTDGTYPIQSAGLLIKALQYVKAFDGLIIQIPEDKTVANNGLMNEGIISTRLGLAGKPAIAEEIMVARDIELLKYTHSKLHITGISSARSIELIQKARTEGLSISCSVTPYHLYFTDEDLKEYDTNLKVNPPIRSKLDREALRKGIKDGIIDCIASHHRPHEWDSKVTEFEYAKDGMTGLETCFSVCLESRILPEEFVKMQTENLYHILGKHINTLTPGAKADLTLFDPNGTTVYRTDKMQSKSKNSPFLEKDLKGKVFGIINGEQVFLNQN